MLISLIFVMFERRTALQMLSDAADEALISKTQWAVAVLITSGISVGLFQSFGSHPLSLSVALLGMFFLLRIALYGLRAQRIRRCEYEILLFLDELVLEVRSGRAFPIAFRTSGSRTSPYLQHLLHHCVRVAETNGRVRVAPSPLLGFSLRELAECLVSTHQALKRCMALRYRLKVLSGFRRRSGQVTAQVRAQGWVVAGMYLATVVFVRIQFGLERIKLEATLSVALFSMGVFMMFLVQRGQKWKI